MEVPKFTAKVYLGNDEVTHNSGDDADELYDWMLAQSQGKFGDLHGELIDNKTNKVVRRFRKSPPD
jgi:hypothetical protein